MSLLFTSQRRFLRHAPWSAMTAMLGVALGVASVVAVHLISAEVQRSLDASAPPHLAGLTHMLERPGIDAAAYFDLRDWWRSHPDSDIRGLVPIVEGHTLLAGRRVQVFGADWLAVPRGTASGGSPAPVAGDVLVGEAVLVDAALGLAEGDIVTLAGRNLGVAAVRETGLGPALFADIALAQHLLGGGPDLISRVGLAIPDPWDRWRRWLNRLMPGFGAGVPAPGTRGLDELLGAAGFAQSAAGFTQSAAGAPSAAGAWRAVPVAAERPSASFARSVLFNLGALGSLALLVAWFLIYQVGVIWLRRQHLVLQRLHMVGVDPRRLRRSFLILFLGLGLGATAIGLIAGVLLAALLMKLSAAAIDVSVSAGAAMALDPWVLAKAIGSGLGVCLVAGVGAFAREWQPDRAGRRRLWWALPLLLILMLLGIGVERSGVLGGFAAIFAMSLVGVLLVSPALALLRRSSRGLRGRLLTRLALREVAWYPRVLNVALAALTLAVATGIGVGLMVESFRDDFQRMLDLRLAGDLYLYDLDTGADEIQAWLAAQPDVRSVRRFGEADARVAGVPVEVGYGAFDRVESARYGFSRALRRGEALVSERLLRDLDVSVGSTVQAAAGELTVAGTFPGFGDARGRVLVDVRSLERLGLAPYYDRLSVTLLADAVEQPDAALTDRLAARFPGVEVESRGAIRSLALSIFDRTFAITQALTLLALVVAVVGTYNALTALRLNQAASTVLLRAQGVNAGENRRIALVRAVTVGGVAVALAVPLGIAMAWTLCTVINPRSFGWSVALHVPAAGWLPPVVLGLAAAVLAGLLPAPRERGALHEAG